MANFRGPESNDSHEGRVSTPIADWEKNEQTPAPSSRTSDDSFEADRDPRGRLQHGLPQGRSTDTELVAVPETTHTISGPELTCTVSRGSILTSASRPSPFEVDFTDDDPDDPHNWPVWYRAMVLGFVSFATRTSVLYSTSYTSGMPGMMLEFDQPSETIATLGVTTYMIGLSVGSLVLAPVSEIYGRQPVYIASLLFFCLTTLPCALAQNLAQVQGMRFLG